MAGSARSRASNALHVKTTASGPSGAKRTNCAKPAKAFANRLLSFALPARSLACVRRPCGCLTQERGLEWHKVGVLRAAAVVVVGKGALRRVDRLRVLQVALLLVVATVRLRVAATALLRAVATVRLPDSSALRKVVRRWVVRRWALTATRTLRALCLWELRELRKGASVSGSRSASCLDVSG